MAKTERRSPEFDGVEIMDPKFTLAWRPDGQSRGQCTRGNCGLCGRGVHAARRRRRERHRAAAALRAGCGETP